jgi:hypothetical protein
MAEKQSTLEHEPPEARKEGHVEQPESHSIQSTHPNQAKETRRVKGKRPLASAEERLNVCMQLANQLTLQWLDENPSSSGSPNERKIRKSRQQGRKSEAGGARLWRASSWYGGRLGGEWVDAAMSEKNFGGIEKETCRSCLIGSDGLSRGSQVIAQHQLWRRRSIMMEKSWV